MERVAAGLIANRDDIIDLFQEELGLEITRAGQDYITVLDPETSKRYRLKGKVYEREFRLRSCTSSDKNQNLGHLTRV